MDSLETRRQFIHACGFVFSFFVLWAGHVLSIIGLGIISLSVFLIAEAYKRDIKLPIVCLMIDHGERTEVIEETPARGAMLFFFGSFVSAILYGNHIRVVAATIVILAFGDSVSTLIGKNFGRHKIPYNKMKSIEGSVAGAIAALLGAMLFVNLQIAVVGAFSGMLVDSLPLSFDDNITIPVFSGLIMSLAIYLI